MVVVRANNSAVQVKYTNHVLPSEEQSPFHWKGRETYMLLIGSDPRAMQKDAGSKDQVFLLPDQIKRDKGVWWMPWQ